MGTRTKTTIKRCTDLDVKTLREAFDEYVIEKRASNIAPQTEIGYKNTFHKFTLFINEDTKTNEITDKLIFEWINEMKSENLKIVSINSYLRTIRTFLYWCMSEHREYVKSFKIKLLANQEEAIKTYSQEELDKILIKPDIKADFADWRTYTAVGFILDCGARASSVVNIRMCDIDFTNGYITLTHTKNKKLQRVPMSSFFSTALRDYIRMWRRNAHADDYLFCNVGEKKLTVPALRSGFEKYCKRRGLNKSHVHGLRHTFAKGYLLNNGNTFKLQQILGHSTLDMTRKYVTLFSEDIKDGHDELSPFAVSNSNKSRKKEVKRHDDEKNNWNEYRH